jgi:hypothetical protein
MRLFRIVAAEAHERELAAHHQIGVVVLAVA